MKTTKVIFCTCKHEYQDKRYGQQQRLHNAMVKEGFWRCTVCGAERQVKPGRTADEH
jgi:hypothetical protein